MSKIPLILAAQASYHDNSALLSGCGVDFPLNWNEFLTKELETKRVGLKMRPFARPRAVLSFRKQLQLSVPFSFCLDKKMKWRVRFILQQLRAQGSSGFGMDLGMDDPCTVQETGCGWCRAQSRSARARLEQPPGVKAWENGKIPIHASCCEGSSSCWECRSRADVGNCR